MRKFCKYNHLASYDKNKTQLRLVGGNPFVTKSAAGKNQERLTLIWGQLVSKKPKSVKVSQTPRSRSNSVPELLSFVGSKGGAVTFVVALVTLGFFFGSWRMKSELREELRGYINEAVEKTLAPIQKDLGEIKNEVLSLRADVENIKGRLNITLGIVYRNEASALGIKEPQIVPIQLSELSPIAPPVFTVKVTFEDGTLTQLEFKIGKVTPESITFLVNGNVQRAIFRDVEVTISRQIGVPVELSKVAPLPDTPRIMLTILDFPTKDIAVVAVGQKSNS